jgi:endonuclease/exonuclease/phosphatase family metal-dependent hydrolase
MFTLSRISKLNAGVLLTVLVSTVVGAAELSVVTFNVWGAGSNEGKSIAETVAVLKVLNADVLALQETRSESDVCIAEDCDPSRASVASDLGEALGYFVFEQTAENDALWANAVLSRHPIVGALPQELGAIIDVDGEEIAVFNVHLTDYPYQPYQLTGIAYGSAPFLNSEEAAVASAERARGAVVDNLLEAASDVGDRLTFICGDFNEPSHLDWTENAVHVGRIPLAVSFPTSKKLEKAGFEDAYRSSRTGEISHPGLTWTPTASLEDEKEHHDRIDFVYVKGHKEIISADIAGEAERAADIVVAPWPSDHRAVKVRIRY